MHKRNRRGASGLMRPHGLIGNSFGFFLIRGRDHHNQNIRFLSSHDRWETIPEISLNRQLSQCITCWLMENSSNIYALTVTPKH